MSTTFTPGVYRYDVLDRRTGRYAFSTDGDPRYWTLDTRNVVHDTVSGTVLYGDREGE